MFLSADKIICQTSSWLFDVIFDQPNNFLLSDKIETVQYTAVLAITGATGEPQKGNCIRS